MHTRRSKNTKYGNVFVLAAVVLALEPLAAVAAVDPQPFAGLVKSCPKPKVVLVTAGDEGVFRAWDGLTGAQHVSLPR